MRFGKMADGKTLLFLSAVDCHACIWQNGELSAATHFSSDTEGKRQFAAFLRTRRAPIFLLADFIEEDFRHETVPHLRSSERSALIGRKLEQYYRNTPFRQATMLSRRKNGRNKDEVLFSALTNPALLSPWLDIMRAHEIALAGIYSISGISARLLNVHASGKLLLLSWEKHAGLRQTYFDAGQLRFSRLTPLGEEGAFGVVAETEVARTHQYLNNLSLLPPDTVLNVQIICHAHDRPELETRLSDNACMRYHYLDIQELGQHVGSKTVYADSDATPLFLYLLASHQVRNHYADAESIRFLRLLHLRHALFGMSAALATVCLWLAASGIMEGMRTEAESLSITGQVKQLAQQTRQITRNFPVTMVPAADMKAAVLLTRELDGYSPAPQKLLDGLSRTLDDFPAIRINKLAWQAALPDTETNNSIALEGELAEFTGDYRSALAYLEHFRQELMRQGYDISAQSLPLDIGAQGSISDAIDLANPDTKFSLKLLRKTSA